MIKYIFFTLISFFTFSLHAQQFDQEALVEHVKTLSSDAMEGRGFGEPGGEKAAKYIADEFKRLGVKPAFEQGYFQPFSHSYQEKKLEGQNVVGIVPGESDKIIVVTAHQDHLGIRNGEIYNGADDNASGTAALFSIAEHFLQNKPKHTIMLAAVDAEEIGSIGAQYLIDNFPRAVEDIVLNVNLDMIAHNDQNELYVAGTYFYPQLKAPLADMDVPVKILFGHDSPEYKGGDNWTYASDHRVFHRKEIPFVYFGVEDHEDYHRATDDFENINPEFFVDAVKSIVRGIEVLDEKL